MKEKEIDKPTNIFETVLVGIGILLATLILLCSILAWLVALFFFILMLQS